MREKIVAQLAVKYPGVPKSFLGLWADKLQTKVTEESQIEGVINELDNLPVSIPDLAKEYQKEGDRRVTEAEKKFSRPGKTEPTTTTTEEKEGDTSSGVPDWGKALLDELKSLKAEKVQTSMKQKLAERLKDEKIPEKFYSRIPLPQKEEELDDLIESIKTDYTALKQELVNDGFSQSTKPGAGSKTAPATAVATEIKAWAEKGKPEKK